VGEVGALVGATGAGVGEVGTLVGVTGAGVGEVGTLVGVTGAGVGEVGALVGVIGAGVGEVGALVGATGAGVATGDDGVETSKLFSQNSGTPNGYLFPFSSQQFSRFNSSGHSVASY